MSVTITFTDSEHRRLLALVRTQALIEHDVAWDEAVELLELDRPASNVVPIASVRADVAERKAMRWALERLLP